MEEMMSLKTTTENNKSHGNIISIAKKQQNSTGTKDILPKYIKELHEPSDDKVTKVSLLPW